MVKDATAAGADAPLVSVVVRTIGRSSLQRSIDSVASQTHRRIELVLVHARAAGIATPRCDGLEVRIAGGSTLNRPQAANAGLDAAGGDWILFLDDDDRFASDHVASLLATAITRGARVAYSATSCVDAGGVEIATIRTPFDRRVLFRRNYIQIGAALFHRSLVDDGACRFDESFEMLQDWDFWLQLSEQARFEFTERATNIWSITAGGSGAGTGANRDADEVNRYGDRIVAKWKRRREALDRRIAHHERLVRLALDDGRASDAAAHERAIARLVGGPPSKAARSRAAQRSRTTFAVLPGKRYTE